MRHLRVQAFEGGSPLAGIETAPFMEGGAPPGICDTSPPTAVSPVRWGIVKSYFR
jgi:hypothetical protein